MMPLRSGVLQQLLQRGLALGQRLAGQVGAVEMQEIEHVVDEAVFLVLERVLQRREIADAVLLDHDLAVDQRGVGGEVCDNASATGLNLSAQSSALRVSSWTSP